MVCFKIVHFISSEFYLNLKKKPRLLFPNYGIGIFRGGAQESELFESCPGESDECASLEGQLEPGAWWEELEVNWEGQCGRHVKGAALSFLPLGVRWSSSSSLEFLQSPQSLSSPFKKLLLFQKCVIPQKPTSIDSVPVASLRWVRLLLCIISFNLHHKLQRELQWSLLTAEKTETQKGQIFIQGHMGSMEKPGLLYTKAGCHRSSVRA